VIQTAPDVFGKKNGSNTSIIATANTKLESMTQKRYLSTDPRNSDENNGVIAKDTDITHGVGTIDKLVIIGEFLPESAYEPTDNAIYRDKQCNQCGYDRAEISEHTEVRMAKMKCANCETTIARRNE